MLIEQDLQRALIAAWALQTSPGCLLLSNQVSMQGNDDVGPTYANGLIDLALEKDCLDEVHSDIDTLVVSLLL